MTSLSIRKEIVPLKTIIFHSDKLKPAGWTNETTLFDKFIKATVTAATEPGGAIGNATHTHTSAGGHTHAASVGSSHVHVLTTTAAQGASEESQSGSGTRDTIRMSHDHKVTLDAASPAITISTDNAHTHDAVSNDPSHKTVFFLKHTETSIGLRRRNLGFNSVFMWGKTEASLPTRYISDTNFDNIHIKGVLNAGATPNQSLGSNTHQHANNTAHDHDIAMPAHSHTATGNMDDTERPSDTDINGGASQVTSINTHNHTVNTIAANTNSATSVESSTDVLHQHNSPDHQPAYKSIIFVKQTSIGLRMHGMIAGSMALWLDATADIPTGWQVGDGTNGTFDMRDKFSRGEAGATPGTTAGSNTHTHSSNGGSHTHATVNLDHSHTPSGVTGGATQTVSDVESGTGTVADSGHTHTATSLTTDGVSPSLLTTNDAHTHGSKDNQPSSIIVSIIEKL